MYPADCNAFPKQFLEEGPKDAGECLGGVKPITLLDILGLVALPWGLGLPAEGARVPEGVGPGRAGGTFLKLF